VKTCRSAGCKSGRSFSEYGSEKLCHEARELAVKKKKKVRRQKDLVHFGIEYMNRKSRKSHIKTKHAPELALRQASSDPSKVQLP
jgi:hypothetical protein